MPRIPEKEIERIKKESDLAALVRSSGVELKPQGKDLVGLCPFHDDKTPSLVIDPNKNLWHCLGACGTGGGPVDWVMKLDGVDFRTAVKTLGKGNYSRSPVKEIKAPTEKETVSPEEREERQALMKRVVDYYHATLKKSPEAQKYLEKRGLVHPEVEFGISNNVVVHRFFDPIQIGGVPVATQIPVVDVVGLGDFQFVGRI